MGKSNLKDIRYDLLNVKGNAENYGHHFFFSLEIKIRDEKGLKYQLLPLFKKSTFS